MRTRRPPLGRVGVADLIYFKLVGGGLIGAALAAEVIEHCDLRRGDLARLRRRFGREIAASPAFWRAHRHARHAVLVRLAEFRRVNLAIRFPRQYGTAWVMAKNLSAFRLSDSHLTTAAEALPPGTWAGFREIGGRTAS
ncbi:MAG: hypothetical protein U1D55_13525 [Phycisphaerae bacterium]